ncbi:MAG: hemerythrin domain-containing protein [Burkholderiales bacterium]|nr:MAG: hemerythrin domain-containing protein [Burkholderiales bacterium]TAG83699.1 MAG: hemerythrin domain-containing protein [Betaproteobacteria bacterium]
MKDIYHHLRASHERQRELIAALLQSAPRSEARSALFTSVRRELMAHAAAEERFLYAPIMHLDAGLASSRHALSEHHEIDELLEELSVSEKSARGWMTKAKKLGEEVRHHLEEEERKFFQISGKLLSARQKSLLAKSYDRDYQRLLKIF